ncbi:MAG TPA: 3'-5' exonuclease [Jiangellaceae bacterium]
MTARIVFVDIETTGLDLDRHGIWDVALIVRDGIVDTDYSWQMEVELTQADPAALRLTRYYQRECIITPPADVAALVAEFTAGAYLAGAVPSFDAAFLDRFLRRNGQCPAWHHRLICVESMAMPVVGSPVPLGLGKCAERLGLTVDYSAAHSALGDARLARDVYDKASERAS